MGGVPPPQLGRTQTWSARHVEPPQAGPLSLATSPTAPSFEPFWPTPVVQTPAQIIPAAQQR